MLFPSFAMKDGNVPIQFKGTLAFWLTSHEVIICFLYQHSFFAPNNTLSSLIHANNL